jgi:hypothetical protein
MSQNILDYQLDVLKLEIGVLNDSIIKIDDITKDVKQWAITLWTAAIGGALTTNDLRRYVAATAVVPLLFWLVETWNRRIQRRMIWRNMQISEFLNDGRLVRSFQEGRFVDFALFDPKSRSSAGPKYEEFVSWRRIILFRSLSILYSGMIIISLILGVALR